MWSAHSVTCTFPAAALSRFLYRSLPVLECTVRKCWAQVPAFTQWCQAPQADPSLLLPLHCCGTHAGHCLCWNAQCLEVLGANTCPDPVVPGTLSPPAPTGTRVVLQTGKSVAALDGSMVASYNGTIDAGITTQYIASWNNLQVRLQLQQPGKLAVLCTRSIDISFARQQHLSVPATSFQTKRQNGSSSLLHGLASVPALILIWNVPACHCHNDCYVMTRHAVTGINSRVLMWRAGCGVLLAHGSGPHHEGGHHGSRGDLPSGAAL